MILLMDEPFGALRPRDRASSCSASCCRSGAHRRHHHLRERHSVEEAVLLADRVLVMSAGPGRIENDLKNRAGAAARRVVAGIQRGATVMSPAG